MNLYEMLRRFAANSSYSEVEQRDFAALIEYMEGMNAFGTVAGTDIVSHAHRYQWDTMNRVWTCMDCGIPNNEMDPPQRGKKLDAWGRYVSE